MKVQIKEKDDIEYGKLKHGEVFKRDGHIFIVINETDKEGIYKCVWVNNGEVCTFREDTVVERRNDAVLIVG